MKRDTDLQTLPQSLKVDLYSFRQHASFNSSVKWTMW